MARKKYVNEIFIYRLKEKIQEKGLRQNDLAYMANIAQTAISEYLNPEKGRSPGGPELGRLAQALGVSMGWLWGLEESPGKTGVPAEQENIQLRAKLSMAVDTLRGALNSLEKQ